METRIDVHILMFGISVENWGTRWRAVESALKQVDKNYSLTAGMVETAAELRDYLRSSRNISVVVIMNEVGIRSTEVRAVCTALIQEIGRYDPRPWIKLEGGALQCEQIFKQHWISVVVGDDCAILDSYYTMREPALSG